MTRHFLDIHTTDAKELRSILVASAKMKAAPTVEVEAAV